MTDAPASVARIVWDGLRAKPASVTAGLALLAIVWVTAIGLFLGGAIAFRSRGLADTAFPLMMCGWMTGVLLFMVAQGLSSSSGWQRGWIEHYRRGRLRRWLGSSEATFVDLTGTARQRAQAAERSTEPVERPDATVIAMPVLTVIGAACLGFAGAMALAGHSLSRLGQALGHSGALAFWEGALGLYLLLAFHGLGRASLRVYRWAAERAAVTARAQADVERARLGALQTRMNPHFLFNTLNTVAALAGSDSARAELVVEHLSTMLRHSLQRANRPFTSVDDEMQFIREYLAIEHERLGDRLRVTWDVGADTRSLRVPTASMQPLVENAVRYAVEPRPAGGHLHIASTRAASGYLLRLSVEDDGPGFPAGVKDGRGLADLRERLRAEYGRTSELDTETRPAGARATISVPATNFAPDAPVAGVEAQP